MDVGPVPPARLVGLYARRDAIVRPLLEYLAWHGGLPRATVDRAARRLGLQNRYELARRLESANVPQYGRLRDLVWLECCLIRWERHGLSLRKQARQAGADPKRWYEKVKRVSGRKWSEVRRVGSPAIVHAIELGVRRSRETRTRRARG